jgi:hypothetical protein
MHQWRVDDAYIAWKGADMANRLDWIPTQEEKLVDLMAVWQVKLTDTALQAAYDWPADECARTGASFTAFTGTRMAYQAASTKANRTEKDEVKKAAVDAIRKFVREPLG